jgi:ADP-heptose:LPS heptosyltransferase
MTKAKYVLANDSGAMHLASFFGANVIGLFGITDIGKTRPWYGRYIVGNNNNFIDLNILVNYLLKN